MNKKFTPYIAFIGLIICSLFGAKDLNINSLEKEILRYNREGKQKISQQKLSHLLFSDNLTKEEEANVLFYMAATYRSVSDYMMCLDYLNKSSVVAKDLPKHNILKMKIDYEYAFAYFDIKDYDNAGKVMKRISAEKYPHDIPVDKAYILLQEGFLYLLNKDFDNAEIKYTEALQIIKTSDYCNLPVVLVKMMDLYGQKKDMAKVTTLYNESMKISKSCSIVKYETFTAAEMEKIFKNNGFLNEAYSVGKKVDSLRRIEDLENKVSEMHVIDKKYSEKREDLQNKNVLQEKVGASAIAFILLSFVGYSVFKSKNLKDEKVKMEEEIERMKDDLYSYSQESHQDEKFVDSDAPIANSDKLTERQKELIRLMADGLSNKEIAEKLFITESTVKYHIRNIYSILDLKDRKDFFKKINIS